MSTQYSSSQIKLMVAMLETIAQDSSIKFPWDIIAPRAGYNNAKTAATMWSSLKAKIKKDAEAGGEVATTPKKRKKAGGNDGGDESPALDGTKKDNAGAKGRGKKIKVKDEVDDEDGLPGQNGHGEGTAI